MDDIVKKDGEIIGSFTRADWAIPLTLELQCGSGQVKAFTGAKEFSQFALVARCHQAQRLAGSDGMFLVKGEMLEAVRLP